MTGSPGAVTVELARCPRTLLSPLLLVLTVTVLKVVISMRLRPLPSCSFLVFLKLLGVKLPRAHSDSMTLYVNGANVRVKEGSRETGTGSRCVTLLLP